MIKLSPIKLSRIRLSRIKLLRIRLSPILRALAVAIAIAGAIDPAMSRLDADRRTVAIIDAGGVDRTAAVSRALADAFDVHAGPIAGAAATVVIGDEMPERAIATSGALFAVIPTLPTPRVEIERVVAPATASSGSKIPVAVTIRAVGLGGRSLVVDLFAGALAVDSLKRAITSDDERADVVLTLPPSAAGLLAARVIARDPVDRARASERHLVVDVRDQRWRVLVADSRASWASTFVRRALEEDRRFDIASRVGTSKSVSAASGTAPLLTDSSALADFDAIVIGAPDALTSAEVRSLERYARERGGSVVLLLDRIELGAAAPLVGVALGDLHGVERVKIVSAAGNLVATELAIPRGGSLLTERARAEIGGKDTPVIWQSALGAGRVVVNGALDAWRYRVRENGGFATFWKDAIGAAASASPAALELTTGTLRVRPGATFDVRAIVRDAQLSDPSRPAPMVELTGPPQFWPAAERGVFHAAVTAPDHAGTYEVQVQGSSAQGFKGSATLRYRVEADERRPAAALLAAWATANGGTVLPADPAGVVSRVQAAVNARSEFNEPVESHPMRSWWWLPIFVMLLGAEWWIRRRRGER